MTATSLRWISLCTVETQDPEEVWPLKPVSSSDLNWLEMQKGEKGFIRRSPRSTNSIDSQRVNRLADNALGMRLMWSMLALKDGSRTFEPYVDPKQRCIGLPQAKPGIDGLSGPLATFCGLDETSTTANNPYHAAAHILSELMQEAGDYCNMLRFLAFPNTIEPAFCVLLRKRDSRAMLLMAIWYELTPPSFWWISLRVSLERQSIWTYLGRYHSDTEPIRSFVARISPSDLCNRKFDHQGEWQRNLISRFEDLNLLASEPTNDAM